MRRVIRLGDKTSHGGTVTSASSRMFVGGIPVACIGDTCTCPKKGHGNCVIVEGDDIISVDGRAVATEGCKCSCGAVLISSMPNAGRVYEGGAAVSAIEKFEASNRPLSQTRTIYVEKPDKEYDMFFHLINAKTGVNLAQIPYKITLEDGQEYTGTTDEKGYTEKVFANSPQTATIEVPYYDISASSTHPAHGSDACGC